MNSRIEVGSLIPTISSMKSSFSKAEKKVAQIILKQPDKIIYTTVTNFSQEANVGEATIIRFCRKIGYKGFQDFKLALAQELSNADAQNDMSVIDSTINKGDSIEVIMEKVFNLHIKAMKESISLISQSELNKAANIILNAKKVYFFGTGSSGVTAQDMKLKFFRIGFNVDACNDSHSMLMSAALLDEKDIVIGISHSGETNETVEAVRTAKQSGAKVIALTHYMKSSITKEADIVLLTGLREGPLQGGALSTKTSQLYVLDILYTLVFLSNTEEFARIKKKTREAIAEKIK